MSGSSIVNFRQKLEIPSHGFMGVCSHTENNKRVLWKLSESI